MVALRQLALSVFPIEMNIKVPWSGKEGTGRKSIALISASLFEKTDHHLCWPWWEAICTLCYYAHRHVQEKERMALICSPEASSVSECHWIVLCGSLGVTFWPRRGSNLSKRNIFSNVHPKHIKIQAQGQS